MPATPATWLEEFTVNLTTADGQSRPRVTHLTNGNILVIWESTNDTGVGSALGTDLIGQLFSPLGEPIGTEFRANQGFFADDERNADVAALASGGFVVAFEDFDSVNNTRSIRLEEWNADATVSNTVTIIGDITNNADPAFFNPRVAASSNTSVLVVYQEEKVGGDSRIVGKIYDSVANTLGPEISLINFVGNNNTAPSVAVLDNGNYVIAAASDDTLGNQAVSLRIINATGGNVLGATRIADTDGDSQNDREPSVTALTGGGFVVSWTNTDLSDTDIQARIFNNAGVAQGSQIDVTLGGATDNANESAVVALNDGGFIIFFDDDELGELRGMRYDSAGVPVSGEFSISTGGSGIDEIDAELLADGRVAVTFERGNSEIGMEIIDTRDAANATGVYTPEEWQIGTIGNDTITSDGNVFFVAGHDGDDTITTNATVGVVETVFGGAGNDTVIDTSNTSSADLDTYDGGIGTDTIQFSVETLTSLHVINLATGLMTFEGAARDVLVDFENATVNNGAGIIGDGNANVLTAVGDFANTINGAAGEDSLFGGDGNDTLLGGEDDDLLEGGLDDDTLNGGTGADTMTGGLGNDIYVVNSALDVISETSILATEIDTVRSSVSRTLGANQENLVLIGTDPINGTGNELNNRITGNASANRLDGRSGADKMIGGLGNDTYIVDNAADVVSETSALATEIDTVKSSVSRALGANQENLVLTGTVPINGTGNELNNRMTGNASTNIFKGGAGNDSLTGGGGDDRLTGAATTALFGAAEIDTLIGGDGLDRFILGVATSRLYDNGTLGTAGTNGYALITDFTTGDTLQLKGAATQYLLGASPVGLPVGRGLFHDSNASGTLNAGDELIAIIRGPNAVNALTGAVVV
jgi:Ca2+-binding RTX toxin-like protein